METAFFHGFVLALGLILPLGVQNLFILQQGIAQPSFLRTLPAVIAAATCDTILISAAVSGVSLLLLKLAALRMVLLGAGSLFLLYMGWVNWHSTAELPTDDTQTDLLTYRQQILFALSVSFLNPYAFLDIVGVIGTSSLQYAGWEKISFATAAVLVSWLWFTGLSLLGHRLQKLPHTMLNPRYLGRFAALFIWGSAALLLLQ